MITVLIVDDSAMDRRLAGRLLEKVGLRPVYAANGREALDVIESAAPEIVVTDLNMPELDGLALVEAIRRSWPFLPVILMTAHGSEEVAVRALRRGAASYVPKRNLAQELSDTVENVLEIARADREEQRVLEFLELTESRFVLDNDLGAVASLVGHLEASLRRMRICDETGLIQVGVALREALVNAILHGNLETSSELQERDEAAFHALVERRRREPPYCDRRVRVVTRMTHAEAAFTVTDEGPGFDPSLLPDPRDPANLEKTTGRGLLLVRTFMDEVRHADRGRAITLVKRRRRDTSSSPPSAR